MICEETSPNPSTAAQEVAEPRDEGIYPFELAQILAQAGETRRALDWLERRAQTTIS